MAALILLVSRNFFVRQVFAPTSTNLETVVTVSTEKDDIEIVATNISVPWEIAWLPNGDMLVTERPGALRRIGQETHLTNVPGVVQISESGLLGLALHPNYTRNKYIYLYFTTRNSSNQLINRVVRYKYEKDQLSEEKVIVDNIPANQYHNGGRIKFGLDGYLYIATGDASNSANAQDLKSLGGKILRVTDEGSIPLDNPFGNAVYSWGHRNPQGLAWTPDGQLYATEHGRSGLQTGFDELNKIERGKNYGWPTIEGDGSRANMEQPLIHSGSKVTWAPAELMYYDGSLYFAGLRGESIYEFNFGRVSNPLRQYFRSQFGRLRVVAVGPDGFIYIATSNTDGRGEEVTGDDRIIRINPELLQ